MACIDIQCSSADRRESTHSESVRFGRRSSSLRMCAVGRGRTCSASSKRSGTLPTTCGSTRSATTSLRCPRQCRMRIRVLRIVGTSCAPSDWCRCRCRRMRVDVDGCADTHARVHVCVRQGERRSRRRMEGNDADVRTSGVGIPRGYSARLPALRLTDRPTDWPCRISKRRFAVHCRPHESAPPRRAGVSPAVRRRAHPPCAARPLSPRH